MPVIIVILIVLAVLWLFGWVDEEPVDQLPEARERVIAQVLLHEARRKRELAELERIINERADQRLHELTREKWPEP